MNVHRNGMNKLLMIIIDYCLNARINRLITALDASSPLEDPSSSFVDATVEPDVFGVVVFRLLRRFVVGCTSPGIPIVPPATFGIPPPLVDGLASPPAGRAGVTALTFEAIHAK